jgi:hypothetical protein
MKINLSGCVYQMYVARLCCNPDASPGATVKVVDPGGHVHWWEFDETEVEGYCDERGNLYPAAEDDLCRRAAEAVEEELKANT